jgi:cyclopropane fatty-acyl-phospholipid synthase-like methyltransferase
MTYGETDVDQTVNRLLDEHPGLDVGSGFGGPARQIARRTGNHVTGIDITPAYVSAARDLTAKAGLRDTRDAG